MATEKKSKKEDYAEVNTEDVNVDVDLDDDGKKDAEESKEEKLFTQAELSRIAAKEKKQGRESVLKELGIDGTDAKTMQMVREFLEAQKSEDEKNNEQDAIRQSELEQAKLRAFKAEAKAEAMLKGAAAKYVDDIVELVTARLADENNDGAEFSTVIEELKKKYPFWFESSKEGKDGSGEDQDKKGTGSAMKGGAKKMDVKDGLGAQLAARRKTGAKKSSFWD